MGQRPIPDSWLPISLMMNDGLQDEYDEHRRLEEQLILSLDRFHWCGTFFIVVKHLVDTSAHGIKAHDRSQDYSNPRSDQIACFLHC
jgi:hypothetical protein